MSFSVWSPFGLDPYPLVRPFLFLLDPEFAHVMTIKMLGLGLGPRFTEKDDPVLSTRVFGLDFPNPIGLAAGLDKQAEVVDEFMRFGFGTLEVGTVTPRPQPGNPKPRMFRVKQLKALINRFGFNSVGADVFAERMKAWRAKTNRTRNPVGINIGFNKDSTNHVADYIADYRKVAPYADYIVINVSSPNTPGIRDYQDRERLSALLDSIKTLRESQNSQTPVLLKIAPDLSEAQLEGIASVVMSMNTESGGIQSGAVQGVIVSNTTITRIGGISGPPLFETSTQLLSDMYRLTQGSVPLVGSGGVNTGKDAYAKIRAGASLVQVYTALVYEGPLVVRKIKRELAALLRRDGFSSVAEAVGADHKA